MEVKINFTSQPFTPPGKGPRHPFSRRLHGPHSWSGCCEGEERRRRRRRIRIRRRSHASAGNRIPVPLLYIS
jgi:hypothetical protein